MGSFACKTRDATGALVERTVTADSRRGALTLLEQSGLVPVEIQEVRPAGALGSAPQAEAGTVDRRLDRRVHPKALMRFSLQLASALGAGMPMLASLESIRGQTGSKALDALIGRMIVDIGGGLTLSGAMLNYPRAFPRVYASTIAAGERSGSLDRMLENLAEFLEAEVDLRADVRSAMLYPAIVIATLTAAVGVLLVFVVPRFAEFYSGFGADLPLPTRLLITGSELAARWWYAVLAGAAALGWLGLRFGRSARGREWIDRAVLRVPVIGLVVETATTLHVVQLLGLTTQAGVPMLEGLDLIATSTPNARTREKLTAVADGIVSGQSLAASMEAAECFPPSARRMLATGEVSGTLERACEAVAKHYKRELHHLTKNLAVLIEPFLTLVLAVIVLFVALAVFLPMWDLVKVVR